MTEFYETQGCTGNTLRWFSIDIDAKDIVLVECLLEVVKAKAVDAIKAEDIEAAHRLTDTAHGIKKALDKAKG